MDCLGICYNIQGRTGRVDLQSRVYIGLQVAYDVHQEASTHQLCLS